MLTTIVFFFAFASSLYLILGMIVNFQDGFKLSKLNLFISLIVISILWSLLFYLLN